MAKDVRQSDDKPVNDASSGADVKEAAASGDAEQKSRLGPKPKLGIKPSGLQGIKYFNKLKPLVARLHDVGTECDKANNHDLHMGQYCLLILIHTGRAPTKAYVQNDLPSFVGLGIAG